MRSIQVASTQKQLDKAKNRIQCEIYNQKSSLSLFEKLQIYDRVISDENLSTVDQQVLKLFQQILQKHGNEDQMKSQRSHNFSSPPSHKKYQIQDPQLFSFSKTRKDDEENHHNQKGKILNFEAAKTKNHNNKKYNLTDKPKPSQNIVSSEISEFISEESRLMNNEQPIPIHQLSKRFKNYLIGKNLQIFIRNSRKQIQKLKQNLKIKSSQYIHQLSLVKKSMFGLKSYYSQQKGIVKKIKMNQKMYLLQTFFTEWKLFTNRGQQQRENEKQVKQKRIFLSKKIYFEKFIQLCTFSIQNQERINFDKYLTLSKEDMSLKSKRLRKKLVIMRMFHKNNLKKDNKQKLLQLKKNITNSQLSIFMKLNKCLFEKNFQKQEKLIEKIKFSVYGKSLIQKIVKDYNFTNAYWNIKSTLQPQYQSESKISKKKYLNNKFQKIVLIYQLIDVAEHRLKRKGYEQSSQFQESTNILKKCQNHIAYKQFYRPYKLQKYFSAFKKYFQELKKKQSGIKYGLIGKRVFENFLLKYRDSIENHIFQNEAFMKMQQLCSKSGEKKKVAFLNQFSKQSEKKQNQLHTFLVQKRKFQTLQYLKIYKITKKYYIKRLTQHTIKSANRITQFCFLEWKLFHAEQVHRRYMVKQCCQIRKKYALKTFQQKMNQYGIIDKIYKKKEDNLNNAIFNNKGEYLFKIFYEMKKNKNKNRKKIKQNINALEDKINFIKEKCAIKTFKNNIRFKKLKKNIEKSLLLTYQLRIKFKIVRILQASKKSQIMQQEKINKIQNRRKRNKKRNILQSMMDRLFLNITVKRMEKIFRRKLVFLGLISLKKRTLTIQQQ